MHVFKWLKKYTVNCQIYLFPVLSNFTKSYVDCTQDEVLGWLSCSDDCIYFLTGNKVTGKITQTYFE